MRAALLAAALVPPALLAAGRRRQSARALIALKVFRPKSGQSRQARKHARADFYTVVKCENDIGPAITLKNSM
jgi:hypothetical protein